MSGWTECVCSHQRNLSKLYGVKYIHMCAHTHVRTQAHAHTHMHTNKHACTHTHACMHICTPTYTHTCTPTCTQTHIHTCTRAHTHTHTHTTVCVSLYSLYTIGLVIRPLNSHLLIFHCKLTKQMVLLTPPPPLTYSCVPPLPFLILFFASSCYIIYMYIV